MKSAFILIIICWCSGFSFAQKTDFSGKWILDKGKSKMDERSVVTVQSQTITAVQTASQIEVSVTTEQAGADGKRKVDLGGNTNIYRLDGTETVTSRNTPIGPLQVICKSNIQESKLKLVTSRTFNGGENTALTEDTWELSADGSVLTIQRKSDTQRGTILSELIYRKS